MAWGFSWLLLTEGLYVSAEAVVDYGFISANKGMILPLPRQTDFGALFSAEDPGLSSHALFVRYLS